MSSTRCPRSIRMHCARGDSDLRFPDLTKRRFNWYKWLTIAAIVIPLATGAFYLYKNIRAEMKPGEGDLIVNFNTATQMAAGNAAHARPPLACR